MSAAPISSITSADWSWPQIRQPLDSRAQVTISLVDTRGVALGQIRSPDAPVFDLQIHPTQRLLRASTHGRGLYEFRLDVTLH